MKIREFIIMPHTADTMGLIHRPGVGPNNRFDFKNVGNNRANEGTINWNALRQAGAVMPYLYGSGAKYPDPKQDPEFYRKSGVSPAMAGKNIPPDRNQPNIITSINLKAGIGKKPGEKLTPLPGMSPVAWQKYMDASWQGIKQNAAAGDPKAKEKFDQIKQAAKDAGMPIMEGRHGSVDVNED